MTTSVQFHKNPSHNCLPKPELNVMIELGSKRVKSFQHKHPVFVLQEGTF